MHELADRLVVIDRGEIVSDIKRGEMSLHQLTDHLLALQAKKEAGRDGGGRIRRGGRRAPQRPLARLLATEGVPILLVLIVVLIVLMALAPNAFLGWRTYVSVMINYQPQIICVLGLTLVIAAGRDRSLLPVGDHAARA